MSFTDDLAKLADKVRMYQSSVTGEEDTKASMISPFLKVLGYDTSEPSEVKHEYYADFATPGTVKPKKVDYAIAINSNIVMLVEAKACIKKPEVHDGQLKLYFNSIITVRIGMVTNGIEYRFFTDLHNLHMMDSEPFFTFNILEYTDKDVDNLKFFHRDIFDAANINHYAEGLIYYRNMADLVDKLLQSPSDSFVKFLVSEMVSKAPGCKMYKKINSKVIDRFKPIVKKSIQKSLVELVARSVQQPSPVADDIYNNGVEPEIDDANDIDTKSGVTTTDEEKEAFSKIKAIVEESTKYKYEIHYRDTVSYFGINLNDKGNWWFLRLYLSSAKKTFIARLNSNEAKLLAPGFPVQDVPTSSGETLSKITISSSSDFNKLNALIARCYELEAAKH
ncbi:type I restriction enzyme HsdR N-terminal domain-containing protein [Brunnivagina elsteri]|uniref:Restriction endonuclease subunit R n=1 Tax=Brunnivagina elsteri CCALA 953 TaxID=987040 RepID=A0A2A2TM12_9CYAN|nr:type I restriction enzyme HsdR N-terminal domain-containing protein [Calothrix elsteri]PAX59460.1 restriction endonuclease subunit R [Calothrix elsteri CCALA 953]